MEASQLVYLILPLLVAVLAVLVGRKFGTLAGVAFAGVFVAAGVAWWSSKSSKYATAMTDADDRAWNSKVAVPQFDSTPPAFMGNDPVTITAPMAPTDTEPDLLFQRNRYPKDADKNVVLPYTAESQTIWSRTQPQQEPIDNLLYGLPDPSNSLKPFNATPEGAPYTAPAALGSVLTDGCEIPTIRVVEEKLVPPPGEGLGATIDAETPAQRRERSAWLLTEHAVVDAVPAPANRPDPFYRRDLDVKKRELGGFHRLYTFDRNGTGARDGYGQEQRKAILKGTLQNRRDPNFILPLRASTPPGFGSKRVPF